MKLPRSFRRTLNWLMKSNLALVLVGVLLSAVCSVLYVYQPQFLQQLDSKIFYDPMLKLTHTDTVSPSAPVIIDLDEKSLAEFGQYPWPRYRVALLLAKAAQLGAASIGLDIVFPEDDRTSPRVLQHALKRDLKVDMGFTGLPEQLMDNDKVLGNLLAQGPFVLGFYFNFDRAVVRGEGCKLHPLKVAMLKDPGTPEASSFLMRAPDVVCNVHDLSTNAHGSGFFNTLPDSDGMLRRTPLVIRYKNQVYPSLSLAALVMAMNVKMTVIKVSPNGVESMRVGRTVIPVDQQGRMLFHWRGPGKTFKYVSAGDILADRLPKDALAGRICFVGTSAAGLKDLRTTPFDPIMAGVEAHATVVDTIMQGDFLMRPDWAPGLEFTLVLALGVLSALLITWAKAIWSLIPLAACGGAMYLGALWLLDAEGMYVSPLFPLMALVANFMFLTLLKYLREEEHKKFLHATFQSYLSPELIEGMVKSNTMPELGGEARFITAYFTDIQGFSSFSEILTAHQLVELLNEYLSAMTDILIGEGGTLDKYEGDAIIAFLGAPLDLPDHALRACQVAVSMQNKLLELRDKWTGEKSLPGEEPRNTKKLPAEKWAEDSKWPVIVHNMRMRIGINSGEMVVGNMGSSMRMNYTMMGDAVNLAARLEAAAKQYGVFTMVSEMTMDAEFPLDDGSTGKVRDHIEARLLDNIQVVGKEEPVKVYEVVAMKDGLTEREKELFSLFEKAMGLYLAMEWDQAVEAFQQSQQVERFPDNKTTPSLVMMERCRLYKEQPPVPQGQTWDGVFRLTKK